ncbi:DUF6286 domain-containing protein [Mycolicibacterium mucogenicum]|uniref:DUF6286 domain-containing protein n=1 Tax=Mycolicibacterium TaxID=1866885 RepID=UPI002269F2A2|nr:MULTISPECIES: DUF6286 domain-containing protein [Mycolicibacterium]MCX8561953.1 DUF6286 domain-containing protein [Mycolicibacterium mucogenicum]
MTADNLALPAPGRSPVAAATARYVAVALALVVMFGGVVSLREAGVELGWVAGTPWIGTAITALNGLRSQWWMVPAGAVALLLGLWLVVVAVRPRRKTVVAVDAAGSVWMRPRDVARLASHAASCVPGVEVLNSAATRRKVTMYVGITGAESDTAAKGAIAAAVGSATETLVPTPRIVVRIGTSGAA